MKDSFDPVDSGRRNRKQKHPRPGLPPRPPRRPRGSSAPPSDVQRPSQMSAVDYSVKLLGRAIMSQIGMITRSGLPSYAYPGMITKSGLPSHDYPGSTKRIEIPNELVGIIIGKTGETIKSIRLNSGAKIQVTRNMEAGPNSLTTTVELNGTPEQISSAEKLINDALAEGGFGGSNIISTQESGDMEPGPEHCHTKTPKDMASPSHLPSGGMSTESRAYLVGLMGKFEAAKQIVNQIIKGDSGDPGISFAQELGSVEPIAQKFQMKVPNDKVYAIIGKSGETIKHIRLESGAKIQLTKDTDAGPNSPTTVVELNGTSQQISSAEKLINDVLAEGDLGCSDVISAQESGDMEPDVEHCHMKIPKNMVGVIIGESGETIKCIRLQSGAKIQFPKDTGADSDSLTTTVELYGTIEQIMSAMKLIDDALAEGGSVDPGTAFAKESSRMEPGAEWYEMKFPSDKVGAIIGESGETIKRIQLQSGAKIQFPKDTGADSDSLTTTVTMYGTIEQMRSAEKLINDAIAESRRTEPGSELLEMKLPSDKVGAIIGKSGETIKRIRLQSGAKIQFTEDTGADTDSPTTTVELFGTIEQITSAKKLINDALAKDDSGGCFIGSDSTSLDVPRPPSIDDAHRGT
ncbi:unnamed protein product [Musa acuminata subsp. malaccensis]|uniref:(wild Malaysian banana) hypothetical protein n=1 Tax=Musa acuminata subsp. malaccensis TaxID=214687 RepID=A0A804KR10_MUSAM|nr:PREDICTED: far upstream element-binding protein 2-like isoform X1 [Musa acuminata subsp. malaccensis]CAG1852089.1 unnamed protein product [Musa acuminata subsp. malaccensis]